MRTTRINYTTVLILVFAAIALFVQFLYFSNLQAKQAQEFRLENAMLQKKILDAGICENEKLVNQPQQNQLEDIDSCNGTSALASDGNFTEFCASSFLPLKKPKFKIIIAVSSSLSSFQARRNLRQAYFRLCKLNPWLAKETLLRFFVGRSDTFPLMSDLKNEIDSFNDIISIPFDDEDPILLQDPSRGVVLFGDPSKEVNPKKKT